MRVTESMGPAWETMKRVLFRPFNLGTWFSFGLVFFLQSCVEGSGSFNLPNTNSFGNHGSNGGHRGGSSDDNLAGLAGNVLGSVRDPLQEAFKNIDGGMVAIALGIGVVVAIPLILLMYWLGTRGQMMAIQAVASERAEVGQLWAYTKPAANRLLKFSLGLFGLTMLVLLPAGGGGYLLMRPVLNDGARIESVLPGMIMLAVVVVLFMLPFAVVGAMLRNFVAPLMLEHGLTAREGWKRFWPVGKQYVGPIFGFFVLRFFVSILAAIVGTIASVLTCCLGFLPVLHQTIMAPYYVFERAWTLEALASMSADFDLRGGGGGMGVAPVPMPFAGNDPGPYNPYAGTPGQNPYAPPGYGGGQPPGGFGSPQ